MFLRWLFGLSVLSFYPSSQNKLCLFRRRNGASGRILRNRPLNATSFFARRTPAKEEEVKMLNINMLQYQLCTCLSGYWSSIDQDNQFMGVRRLPVSAASPSL